MKLENDDDRVKGCDEVTDSLLEELSDSVLDKCFVNVPMKWSGDNLKKFLNDEVKCVLFTAFVDFLMLFSVM